MTRFIRLALYLALGLILGASATFASAASTYGNTSTKGMKGGAWNGSGTIDSGRTAQTIESINVGGKYIPVPMLGSVGAAALEALIIGLKSSPKALVVGGVVSYLTSKGLSMQGDVLKVKDPATYTDNSPQFGQYWYQGTGTGVCRSAAAQCSYDQAYNEVAARIVQQWGGGTPSKSSAMSNAFTYCVAFQYGANNYPCISGVSFSSAGTQCPTGFALAADGKTCLSTEYTGPNESDWDKIRNDPPLADVMKELCDNLSKLGSGSYACPVSNQHATATTEPLSEWKTDPLTGQQSRQVAKITPSPTTSNPERVQIDIETETKTPATTNPDGSTTPEKTESKNDEKTDFCVLHPDSIACSKLGDLPDDPALDPTNKDVSITRQDWGAADGTCPNDLSYTLRLTGHTVGMSYKPVCDGLRMFRPVVIGMGWLAAIFAFLGISRRAQG